MIVSSADKSNEVVDLRSDTLTAPDEGMRAAIAAAEVGDDVYGEDPTVNALEAEVAEMFGKPAALFVPTGSMGNQICVRLVVPPAGELICDADAHIVTYEEGGIADHGSVQTRTIVADRGLLDPEAVERQIRPAGYHNVPTSAVAVEQTHNRGGGAVYPIETLAVLREITARCGVALHCDGARIWNAHVATGVPLATYGALFDTLSVCLSKGLGAPIGSLVVADREQVARGRVIRKRLGGGMRQVGVIAAAGRYALANNMKKLADDHRRARELAAALAERAAGVVDPSTVDTNMVVVDLAKTSMDARSFAAAAKASGVLVGVVSVDKVRIVTHLDVDDQDCAAAADVLGRILASA
jgi:threonine aldolase